jgi:predicted transporter
MLVCLQDSMNILFGTSIFEVGERWKALKHDISALAPFAVPAEPGPLCLGGAAAGSAERS